MNKLHEQINCNGQAIKNGKIKVEYRTEFLPQSQMFNPNIFTT